MYPVIWLKVTNQGTKLNLGVFVVVQVILWLIVGEWFSQSVIVHFEAPFRDYDQILFFSMLTSAIHIVLGFCLW